MITVDWQQLSVEQSSVIGLFAGKYIHAVNDLGVEFMLGHGVDRHSPKVVLINVNPWRVYVKRTLTQADALHLAEDCAVALQRAVVEVVADQLLTDGEQAKDHSS